MSTDHNQRIGFERYGKIAPGREDHREKREAKVLPAEVRISEAKKQGISNVFTQAAILAIISKESSFVPTMEKGYASTSTARIKSVFGSKLSGMTDAEVDALKKDERKFFNKIYGKRYGNDGYISGAFKESWAGPYPDGNDGFRYRGRGFNQITFKSNYKAIGGEIGKDLLSQPELLQEAPVAAAAAVGYFVRSFRKSFGSKFQSAYNSKDINGFKNVTDATLAVFNSNAGFGNSVYSVDSATSTGGLEKSLSRREEMLKFVQSN